MVSVEAMDIDLIIPESEYTISAVRASGPGGQHVNKVSTAIVLRFDIHASSLADEVKARLLATKDRRITEAGILMLRSAASRSQLRNREAVVKRLHAIVHAAFVVKKERKPTKRTKASVEKRLDEKAQRSEVKAGRRKLQ